MNHLEQLIAQWLEFKGYFVRCNVNVGRLSHGGHEGELDVVAFHPGTNHVLHVEASGEACTWDQRDAKFRKRFSIGKKYIFTEVFPWLSKSIPIEQWAVWGSDKNHTTIGGGRVVPASRLYAIIARDVRSLERGHNRIVPEKFSLLRTMQVTMRTMRLAKPLINDVTSIKYRRGYVYRIRFDDGLEGDVDFREYVGRGPVFKAFSDLAFFRQARLEGGTIAWPNGADIAPETLYEKIRLAGMRTARSASPDVRQKKLKSVQHRGIAGKQKDRRKNPSTSLNR